MTYLDLKTIISDQNDRLLLLKQAFNIDKFRDKLKNLDQLTFASDFWQDPKSAQLVIQEANEIKSLTQMYDEIIELYETLELTYELSLVDDELNLDNIPELTHLFQKKTDELTIKMLLNKPYDKLNAVIDFHPGAGGTESQDWAEMLYRMYTRWADSKNFKVTVLDYLDGDEAGLKSATILVTGKNAYGYLKAESGVHRLVRLSPFDASGKRHTSFASVSVVPEIDESIEVEINEQDLKIDTYRSSGNGGQSVNTTDSAVRITHLPTKTVVTCQNERSQLQNKDTAMHVLKGKLFQLELEKKQAKLNTFSTSNVSNAFGSQIRSYVFHPYSMVKDLRTGYETSNAEKVMNGDLDDFIQAYLLKFSE
ncbi:MAG: peptide chain release factor 2 [Firmicutes bacterium]|nr:peptide chain release factor 2 [Bacillota bacterium]